MVSFIFSVYFLGRIFLKENLLLDKLIICFKLILFFNDLDGEREIFIWEEYVFLYFIIFEMFI